MRRVLPAVLLVLLTAAGAHAYSFTDCAGNECFWAIYPVGYAVQEPLGIDGDEEQILAEIQTAFARWDYEHQTFCEPLKFNYTGRVSTGTPAALDQKNIVSFATDVWEYGPSALAVTSCWYNNDGRFVECDIIFNAVDYRWSVDGADGTKKIRETLTHEVGHFWGLDHSSSPLATMYPFFTPESAPEDLDEDDIRGAAVRFCNEELPADDTEEPNDSRENARFLNEREAIDDLRLYDDDWWRIELAAGKRLKIEVNDDLVDRFKYLALYDEDGDRLDQQRCDGDCAQALGEAGDTRIVYLQVHGDYDNNAVQAQRYDIAFAQVEPGEEGELFDDDAPDDDDDDDGAACGCSVAAAAPLPFWLPFAALATIGMLFRFRR